MPPSAHPWRTRPGPAPRRGMGALTALMVLVVLAAMAAAVMRLGRASATTSSQDLMGLRAAAAARAGVEWGLYQAFKGSWTTCSSASQTLNLNTDLGMTVVVGCDSTVYNEGESALNTPVQVRVITIDAVACNSTTCPDAAAVARESYVERRRQAVVN